MLLQFSVNNFRSIKDTVVFSMATASKDGGNSFKFRKYELLTSAVLYGANASGKSNILRAMAFMKSIVLNQAKVIQSVDRLPHEPFRLNTSTKNASSTFEIVCFIDSVKYRYGFEADESTVYSEWLYADEKGKEAKLFYRDIEDEEYVNPIFKEGYKFFDKKTSKIDIAKNQLFIWKCDQNSGLVSTSILGWFGNFNLLDGLDHDEYVGYTMRKMEDQKFKELITELVKTADVGIDNIDVQIEDLPKNFFEDLPFKEAFLKDMIERHGTISRTVKTYHKVFDENNDNIKTEIFDLDDEESLGTRKFFKMSAPILNTLEKGKILLVDELDASLHPMLAMHLVRLFNDKNINTKNAQLIFATHDTNLLKPHIFRRDQIWFTEKDKYGSTHLYSLAEFKNVRQKEDFEKQYIQGKYGAVPYLGKFEF